MKQPLISFLPLFRVRNKTKVNKTVTILCPELAGSRLTHRGITLPGQAYSFWRFALPVAEQTPMSAWNRTPLQALVSTDVPFTLAQITALALWILFLGITVWRSRQQSITFPLAFGLAFVLLYWGRPIGWGFSYLELVVAVSAWPALRGWQKPAVLTILLGAMASRWWAMILTLQGKGMQLLTLQSAAFPWETWLVLPLSWLLLLYVLEQSRCATQRRGM